MAWRPRKRTPQPDRPALSIVHLERALDFRPKPEEITVDADGSRRCEVQIVPAGFPFTDRKVWLVFTASPTPTGVRVELASALASGGERQPLATVDCRWPAEATAQEPDSWSLASLEPELVAAHEQRGAEESPGELLEIVRDRLEQIRAVELEERPELASLAKPVGRGRTPRFPGDGLTL